MNQNIPETLPLISHEARSRWLLQKAKMLRKNPNFEAAASEYASGSVKVFEGRYVANKVMANVSRRVICLAILALHFSNGGNGDRHHGAVISCLQQITTGMGLCSKNTTAAAIDMMENVGLVTRVADENDRRNHLIQPTQQLIAGAGRIVSVAFTAADKLHPQDQYLRLINRTDGFMERYFASSFHSLLNVSALVSNAQGSELFAVSDGGVALLCKLMSLKKTQQYADTNTVSFPYEDVSHLYGVSRTHVRRLMKKAEAEGLVQLLEEGGRRIELMPRLDEVFANMVAARVARAEFDFHLVNQDYDSLSISRSA